MRVAFLMEGYGPYRVPFWNALAARVDLSVILFSTVEKGRTWMVQLNKVNCPVKVLDATKWFLPAVDWAIYWTYSSVFSVLDDTRPDVVIIGGWSSPGYWAGRSWAKKNNIPLVFWSESHALSTRTHGFLPFDLIKRYFLKPFAGCYAFSPLSSQYLRSFGIPAVKIVDSFNLPDIPSFPECERIGDIRDPVLLYVGQLIGRKGLLGLFDALYLVKDRQWRLILVGSGPLKQELERKAKELGFAERVSFQGFVQPEELNNVYRTADILLMPSLNEVWGLVLHEALLSGVFVIGSDRAAASHALIQESVNGFMCSPFKPDEMARAIRLSLEAFPFDRRAIRESVGHITIDGEVTKLERLLQDVVMSPCKVAA